jgi:hypothetical protein
MNILQAISNFFSGAARKIKEALKIGTEVGNIIKQVVDSPLLDVVVNLTKTPLDNATLEYIRPRMRVWLSDIGWADKKLSEFSETTFPHVMNSISAEVAALKAEHDNINLSRQQAIASVQVVYNGKIVEV